MKYNKNLKDRIIENLAVFSRTESKTPDLKRAAVAVAITEQDEKAAFLLTRRAPRLNSHGGQWALPGGRLDPGETPIEAALREMNEEVGLQAHTDAVLGLLDDYPTRSGYLITPVVIWTEPGVPLRANPDEVASIHHIPLSDLQERDAVEIYSIPETDRPLLRLHFAGTQVNSPTASVIHQFNEVAIHGRQTRVAHFDQPVFAWK